MVQHKIDDAHLLVSLYNGKGQNFILKLSVIEKVLKILVTDKCSAERWKCSYDSSYIENLTRKTGNFKQFVVFGSMLKAGLLKTNDCVYVELLTQEELQSRRKRGTNGTSSQKNIIYLILMYQVEFDKIHYPLPLEYCGKPDPEILQATIRKLENEVSHIRCEMSKQLLKCRSDMDAREISFQKIIAQLNNENQILYEENNRLKQLTSQRSNGDSTNRLVQKLETQLKEERTAYSDRIYRLEIENVNLTSILTGRSPRSRVQVKLHPVSTFNRPSSLPRFLNGRTSPVRKSSFTSTEKSSTPRKSRRDNAKGKRSNSSEGLSTRDRKNSIAKKNDRNKRQNSNDRGLRKLN